MLAVASNHQVHTAPASAAPSSPPALPSSAWQRLSAGPGAKGHRFYDWAWITIDDPAGRAPLAADPPHHRTGELAFYRCYSPRPVPLAALVHVAGRRWTVEEDFQAAKGLAGLDQHQVRRWNSWHRWITLAMLAHAFLTVTAAAEQAATPPPRPDPPDPQRNRPPVHRSLHPGRTWHRLHWSRRRRHQPEPEPATTAVKPDYLITNYGWSTRTCYQVLGPG